MTAGKLVPQMKQLRKDGISKRAIAKQLGVSRTSVIRLLFQEARSLERRAPVPLHWPTRKEFPAFSKVKLLS
jgi:orotate phosphoribosyltransferase-like protein